MFSMIVTKTNHVTCRHLVHNYFLLSLIDMHTTQCTCINRCTCIIIMIYLFTDEDDEEDEEEMDDEEPQLDTVMIQHPSTINRLRVS